MASESATTPDENDPSLTDLVVVITGASKGFGKHMADGFVNAGATVVCSSRSMETLAATVEKTSDGPGSATAIPADVRVWDDVKTLVDRTHDEVGHIDVFINNAGVSEVLLTEGEYPPIVDLPIDVWDTVIETNLRGIFLCTKAALPDMLAQDRGRFIHISSGMGVEGRANRSAYVASKFGLEGFHQSLADEIEGTGVSSVVLDPGGGANTPGFSAHLDEEAKRSRNEPSIIVEPALWLAAGKGENGDRFVATKMNPDDL